MSTLALLLATAFAAPAETIFNPSIAGRTLLIRHRSFAPGAPAGWTTIPFTEPTLGSPLVNAQPAALQAALRLADPNASTPFPVEPRLVTRGPVEAARAELARLAAERDATDAQAQARAAALKDLDLKIRLAGLDLGVIQSRFEGLSDLRTALARESARHQRDQGAAAQLKDADARQMTLWRDLLGARLKIQRLESERDALRTTEQDEAAKRTADILAAEDQVAGFYVAPAAFGCARPWTFVARPDQSVNPFYPRATPQSPLGDRGLFTCVVDGRLHATHVLDQNGTVIFKVLYGRNSRDQIDRIVIRDARGALLEDHQYLPGPNEMIRYGLTYRTETGSLVSIYTDI